MRAPDGERPSSWDLVCSGTLPHEVRKAAFRKVLFEDEPGWWGESGLRRYVEERATEVARAVFRQQKLRFVSSRFDTSDIEMEALIVLFDSAPRIREDPAAWLDSILRNLILAAIGGAGASICAVQVSPTTRVREQDCTTPEEWGEYKRIVAPLIDGLTPALRETARLYFIEGMPYELIALRLALTLPTVRQHICRSLPALLQGIQEAKKQGRVTTPTP